jgi:hypothetical protein
MRQIKDLTVFEGFCDRKNRSGQILRICRVKIKDFDSLQNS